jgi:hypothetical protein
VWASRSLVRLHQERLSQLLRELVAAAATAESWLRSAFGRFVRVDHGLLEPNETLGQLQGVCGVAARALSAACGIHAASGIARSGYQIQSAGLRTRSRTNHRRGCVPHQGTAACRPRGVVRLAARATQCPAECGRDDGRRAAQV